MSLHDQLQERDHKRVAEFIESVTGILLPSQKRHLVESRLRKRQRVLNLPSLSDYIDHALAPKSAEQIMLVDALTTNKTEFFRENNHFASLKNFLNSRPDLKSKSTLNIWSSACSTGEEPYTLAMVLSDMGLTNFIVHATDISVSVLDIAKTAVYPHSLVSPIPLTMRKKYLLKSKNKERDVVKIVPELRKRVQFGSVNLVTDDFSSLPQMDIIFCRNVMIYFSDETRHKIAAKFRRKLETKGLLFIGHSESLRNVPGLSQYEPTIYQKVS